MRFHAQSGVEIHLGKNGCFVGACCLYQLTVAEAHQVGLALVKWSRESVQGDEE